MPINFDRFPGAKKVKNVKDKGVLALLDKIDSRKAQRDQAIHQHRQTLKSIQAEMRKWENAFSAAEKSTDEKSYAALMRGIDHNIQLCMKEMQDVHKAIQKEQKSVARFSKIENQVSKLVSRGAIGAGWAT